MFGVVDVRDVADLHLRAMMDPAAKGERFLAIAGDFISMLDIAKILRRRIGTTKPPKHELPNWLRAQVAGVFRPGPECTQARLAAAKCRRERRAASRRPWLTCGRAC
jgi:dihydroflavonol-4-reductase